MHEAVDGGGVYVTGDDFVFLNVDGDDDGTVGVSVICKLIAILAAPFAEVIGEVISLRLLLLSISQPRELRKASRPSSVERSNSVPGANTARRTISSSMRTPKPKTRMRAFFLVKPEHFCVIAYLHSAACKVSTGGNGSP